MKMNDGPGKGGFTFYPFRFVSKAGTHYVIMLDVESREGL
jgi:hypothetical protein